MRLSIQNDHQYWDQLPLQLARCVSGLISWSNDWLQYLWKIRFMENWRIAKVVCPPSLWKKNAKLLVFQCSPLTFCKNPRTLAQRKSPNRASEYTIWSPTVRSTSLEPWTPSLRNFRFFSFWSSSLSLNFVFEI